MVATEELFAVWCTSGLPTPSIRDQAIAVTLGYPEPAHRDRYDAIRPERCALNFDPTMDAALRVQLKPEALHEELPYANPLAAKAFADMAADLLARSGGVVYGALGVTEDTPLEHMYRHARFARIYDGADEVHIARTGERILRRYANGEGFDFGLR